MVNDSSIAPTGDRIANEFNNVLTIVFNNLELFKKKLKALKKRKVV